MHDVCVPALRGAPRWDSLIIVGPKSLPWLTLLRIVFIPLFLLSLHPKVWTRRPTAAQPRAPAACELR